MTTEILLQPLTASYRKPSKEYFHRAFHSFATGPLSTSIAIPLGAYAVAVQSVEIASGATVGFRALGTTTVLEMVEGGLSDEGAACRAA